MFRRCATIAIACAIVITVTTSRPRAQQQRDGNQRPMQGPWSLAGHPAVLQKAIAARDNAPASVRDLVDTLLQESMLRRVAPSIRERIYRNEVSFRKGSHPGIDEGLLIAAVNDRAQRYGLPDYARVTEGQLAIVKNDLLYNLRLLRPRDGSTAQAREYLSPTEALYLMLDIGLQKLRNPEYQVAPEQWEAQARQRRQRMRAASGDNRLSTPPFSVQVRLLKNTTPLRLPDVSTNGTQAVVEIHAFLDDAGFGR